MNYREELLKEKTKEQTEMLLKYVKKDIFRFDQLMYAFLFPGYEPRVGQRAAAIIELCVKQRQAYINIWVKQLVPKLQTDLPVGKKRNILRFLQHATIPEEWQGTTADVCFNFLNSPEEPVAVKVFAMTVLANICKKYPDLAHELKLSIEAQLPFASAGFHARANKIMKTLKDK